MNLSSVYTLSLGDEELLYAPLHGVSARLNRAAGREVRKALLQKLEPHRSVASLTSSLLADEAAPVEATIDSLPAFLGIVPTRQCNAECVYCDFPPGEEGLRRMAFATAIKAVDWYANELMQAGRNRLKVHFFGGEPMTRPQLVQAVVHRARLLAQEQALQTEFEISTNGQFSADWAHFLGDYFDTVVLSLDGPREVQNFQRPAKGLSESFARAVRTAYLLSHSQADLCLRVCVSQLNLEQMDSICAWFCERFLPGKINFEPLRETAKSRAAGLSAPDPFHFSENFVKARLVADRYGVEVVYGFDLSPEPRAAPCPAANRAAIVVPGGEVRCCYLPEERLDELEVDFVTGHLGMPKVLDPTRKPPGGTVEGRCSRCFCRWSCGGGCLAERKRGEARRREAFCSQTRLISVASLLARLGETGTLEELLPEPDRRSLALRQDDRIEQVER